MKVRATPSWSLRVSGSTAVIRPNVTPVLAPDLKTRTPAWAAGSEVPASLSYVPARGLVFADDRGWRVVVGRGPGMKERLQVLEWLVADLEARGLAPRFVDVRFVDAPYYSLTNDW